MKKCIYCGADMDEISVVDFCEKCGINVFGKKMFDTIIQRMNDVREEGDLI